MLRIVLLAWRRDELVATVNEGSALSAEDRANTTYLGHVLSVGLFPSWSSIEYAVILLLDSFKSLRCKLGSFSFLEARATISDQSRDWPDAEMSVGAEELGEREGCCSRLGGVAGVVDGAGDVGH
jgi:hypothetical protein